MLVRARRRGMGDATPWPQENCSLECGADISCGVACSNRNNQAYLNYMAGAGVPGSAYDIAHGSPAANAQKQAAAGQQPWTYIPAGTPQAMVQESAQNAPPVFPVAPASSTPAKVAPGVASINASQFNVGDSFTVRISGASPNQPVSAASTQNGQSHGTANFGQTDAQGNFVVSGVMSADQRGNWVETWMVGGQVAGVLSFTVLQSPGSSGTQSTTPVNYTNTPVPNNAGNGNSTPDASSAPDTTAGYLTYSPAAYATPDYTVSSTTPTALTNFWSFLQQTAQIGSWAVPYWLFGVGGLGAVWAFRGHERARR